MWKRFKAWLLGICDHSIERCLYEAQGVDSQGRDAVFGVYHCVHCDRIDIRKNRTAGFRHG
jgi:hypothetical protein